MELTGRAKRFVTLAFRARENSLVRRKIARLRSSIAARLIPPDFWYGRYPHTFLERQPPEDLDGPSELPHMIWAFWTGTNPMSAVRRAGLEQLTAVNSGIPVVLVTPENLAEYVVDGHPLHPAYQYLSFTHRSDYLRAYFMHHHGGGYSDIKPMAGSWRPHFARMEEAGAWLLGPAIAGPWEAGNNRGRLGVHLRRYHEMLVAGGAIIARSHTPLTAEWLREAERLLTYANPALEEHPCDERGSGSHPGYPLAWVDLLAEILQPLILKHSDHTLIEREAWWDRRAAYR